MTERICEQCGNSFEPKARHQRFDFPECRYQHHVEQSVSAACQRVEPHDLQAVREQRAIDKHNRDLGGLIEQAIVDRIKTTGECFADDLTDVYPPAEVGRCRELATARFGSLAASRGGREPLIREKGRRKSSIPSRKGAKSSVWEFTPAGRAHYGLSASKLVGLGAASRLEDLGGGHSPAGGERSTEPGELTPGSVHPEAKSAVSPPPAVEVAADPGSPASSPDDQLVENLCEEFEAEVVEESSGAAPTTLFGSAPSAYSAWESAA